MYLFISLSFRYGSLPLYFCTGIPTAAKHCSQRMHSGRQECGREKEEEKRGGRRKKQGKRDQHLQEEVEVTHRGEERESDSSSTRSRGESSLCTKVDVSEEEDFGSDHRGEYRDRISSVEVTSDSGQVDLTGQG